MRSREEKSWKFMLGLLVFGVFIFICVWTQTGDFLGTVKQFAKDIISIRFLLIILVYCLVVYIISLLIIPHQVREKWVAELLRKHQ